MQLNGTRVSLFYLIGLFDLWTGLRTLLIDAIGAYWIAAKIRGPYMPWIGFIFLMGHMSINHIIRQYRADPHAVDITGKRSYNESHRLHQLSMIQVHRWSW